MLPLSTLILIGVFIFSLIVNLIYKNNLSKQTNPNKALKFLVKWFIFPLLILIIEAFLYMYVFNNDKSLAASILSDTNPESYDNKCFKLFSHNKSLNPQYLSMKASRPVAETRNLCGNYAKNILGRKV